MKKMWAWLGENSRSLQGALAVLTIITISLAFLNWVLDSSDSDVIVRLDTQENTIPPDMEDWITKISWQDKNENNILEKIGSYPVSRIGRATVQVINQSGDVVSGLRLRMENLFRLWSIDVQGSFLSDLEKANFNSVLPDTTEDGALTLPELPPLPPNTSLTITIYGDVNAIKPIARSATNTITTVETVKVDDSLLVDWIKNPSRFWFLVFASSPLAFLLGALLLNFYKQRVAKQQKRIIFYNKACEFALQGKPDQAMNLLTEAFHCGYSNYAHAQSDKDLSSLREREDFVKLVTQDS